VNNINIFTDPDECVDFLTDLEDTKTVLIVDDTIGQQIMPLIDDIPQLDHVYVESPHSEWFNEWPKVKDIHTTIIAESEASELTIKQEDNHDSIAVSFVPINGDNLNQTRDKLDPSFMYTQILKETLLEMKYDEKSIETFVAFCRMHDYGSSNDIDRFVKEYYTKNSPIWWYTFLPFIYSTINFALRELKADIIIKMGFFIFDLHNQIKQLHSEQLNRYNGTHFIVYRGQALFKTDFEKLRETEGGLISFNNFLSTSRDKDVSLGFAKAAASETDKIGILFSMTINPLILSSPFADIQDISPFTVEKEVLFSMHTVFRVGEIKPIDNDSGAFYQVELELTSDDDEQLRILTKHIGNYNRSDTGWKKLGNLLFQIDQFDKVEELYTALLEQTPSDSDRIYYYNQLLNLRHNQGDYAKVIEYLLKMVEIHKKTIPENDSLLADSDNNIGCFSCNIGEHSRTHYFYKKSFSIDKESLPVNHLSSITCDNNTAEVDDIDRQHSDTLFFEKALQSYQRVLFPDHAHLATSYNNNNAGLFEDKEKDSKVLLFNEKILEIRQKTLPPDHHDLAVSYAIVGAMYKSRKKHSKALSCCEKSLEILEKILPVNHPHLAAVYNTMGSVYDDMEEYSKALLFYQKALEIHQRSLPENHPDLTNSYINIILIYNKMGEYTKGVYFYEKAFPKNDPSSLGNYYRLVGSAYDNLEEYSKAISFYEKSLEILEKTPAANHHELAAFYNTIGSVYFKMAEHTKALQFHERALEIYQEILPPNNFGLMVSYNNIGSVYCSIGDYSKALSYFQLALDISKLSPPADDSNMKALQQNIAFVKEKLMVSL
jgi:tetratricopeptide (TPR) repeat protein